MKVRRDLISAEEIQLCTNAVAASFTSTKLLCLTVIALLSSASLSLSRIPKRNYWQRELWPSHLRQRLWQWAVHDS